MHVGTNCITTHDWLAATKDIKIFAFVESVLPMGNFTIAPYQPNSGIDPETHHALLEHSVSAYGAIWSDLAQR